MRLSYAQRSVKGSKLNILCSRVPGKKDIYKCFPSNYRKLTLLGSGFILDTVLHASLLANLCFALVVSSTRLASIAG